MAKALEIITDAYERCNRLSPGEALNADDIDFGFRRLNLIVDALSADTKFLYKDVITTATQTGHIALGAGTFAAIAPGTEIVDIVAAGLPLGPITMQQYNAINDATVAGTPYLYAHDGMATVFLYPVPSSVAIKVHTRQGVAEFADINTTDYSMPPGYKSALGAILADGPFARNIMGAVPPQIASEAQIAMRKIDRYVPAIVDAHSYAPEYSDTFRLA